MTSLDGLTGIGDAEGRCTEEGRREMKCVINVRAARMLPLRRYLADKVHYYQDHEVKRLANRTYGITALNAKGP